MRMNQNLIYRQICIKGFSQELALERERQFRNAIQVSNPLLLIFYYPPPPLHWHLSSEPSVSCCPSGLPSNHHNTIVCSIYSLVSASLFFPSGSSREEVPKLCQRYSNLSLWDHSLEPRFQLKLFLGVVLESF